MTELIILGSIAGSILIWHFYRTFKLIWEGSRILKTLKEVEKLDEEIEKERQGHIS